MFCCLRTCLQGNPRKPAAAGREIKPEIHLDAAFMGPDVILLSNQLRITGSGGALATAPLVQSKSYFEIKIQQAGSWSVGLATQQTDLSKKCGGGDSYSWCLCSDNATRHGNVEYHPVVVATTAAPTLNTMNSLFNGNASAKATAAAAGLIGIDDVPEEQTDLNSDSNIPAELKDATLASLPTPRVFPDEGDIVGVAFDHIELNFYYNGKNLEVPFRNVKGTVYPVVYVGNGATVDIILDNFNYGPPPGFDKIMLEQSLL